MNAADHRFAAVLSLATAGATLAPRDEDRLSYAAAGCVGGACFGTLPDLIEPASNPHHRQFFHSLVFAGVVVYCSVKLYKWEAETPEEKVLKVVGLLACGAYLVHLAMDATTSRSLPLVGRL